MELQTSKVDLLLDVDQKPELVPGLFLSLQHVFAMFGATVFSAVSIGDASIGCFICVRIRNANLYGCDAV